MRLLTWAMVAAAWVLPACSCNNNDGKCTTDGNCSKGQHCCNGTCSDPASDRNNCGTCGTVCGTQNAASVCVMAVCQLTCQAGFGNCNGSPLDGCETKLSDSPGNCGQCGHSCAAPHTSGACIAGQCAAGACEMGFKDCNTSRSDGCETPVASSSTDCGDCGKVCAPQHTSGHCQSGSCQIGTCETGFDNCNGIAGDGCETDLSSDPTHCGDCATVCDANLRCISGHCSSGGLIFYGGLPDFGSPVGTPQVTSFDTVTHAFVALTTTGTGPGARFGHLAVWDAAANRMIVWGGWNGTADADTNLYALDFNQSPPAWTTLSTNTPPSPRAFMEYGFDSANRVLYLFGGGNAAQTSFVELWKLDLAALVWTQLPSGTTARAFGVGAFENGRLVVGLGMGDFSGSTTPGYAAFDPDAGWTTLQELGAVPGSRAGVSALGDATPLVIWGGIDNNGLADQNVYVVDESHGGFTFTEPLYPTYPLARAYLAATATGGRRYMFGGYIASQNVSAFDLWSLDLDGGWTLESDGGYLDPTVTTDAGTVVATHAGAVLPSVVAR